MSKRLKSSDELQPGDYYEDCAYHPCLCVTSGSGTVEGISLVEAIQWRCFGPPDVPPAIEMTDAQKYWLKDRDYAHRIWPKLRRKRKAG